MDGADLAALAIEEQCASGHLGDFIEIIFAGLVGEPARDDQRGDNEGEGAPPSEVPGAPQPDFPDVAPTLLLGGIPAHAEIGLADERKRRAHIGSLGWADRDFFSIRKRVIVSAERHYGEVEDTIAFIVECAHMKNSGTVTHFFFS